MSSGDTQAIKTNSDDQNKSELANTKRPNQNKSETSRVPAQEETNAVIRETIANRVNNEPAIRDNNEITDDNTPVIIDNSDIHIQATDNNFRIVSDNSVITRITNNLQDEKENRIPHTQLNMNKILVIKYNHQIHIEEQIKNLAVINDSSKLHIATKTDNQMKTGKNILEAKPEETVITDNSRQNMQSTLIDNISINILPASPHEMTKQVNQLNDKQIMKTSSNPSIILTKTSTTHVHDNIPKPSTQLVKAALPTRHNEHNALAQF